MYLAINDISKSFSYHHVLRGVSFVVNSGERVGLVGANGVGKSTLLKIIMGEYEADGGHITLSDDARIGYLEQHINVDDDQTITTMIAQATDDLHRLEARMRDLEAQMTTTEGDALDAVMVAYGTTLEKFEQYGGYELDARVDQVFAGLRVDHLPRERHFATLSGGEKSRVGLALLLLGSPDVLLLDEPTNHLDFASLMWLEDYLQSYRGAVLIVSHDRHFLNRTVTAIVEIDEHSRKAKRYNGNYDIYAEAKQSERRKWAQDYAAQQEEIKALRHEIKVSARRNDNYRAYNAFSGDKFLKNFKKAGHEATISRRVRTAEERLKRIEADPIPEPPDDLRFDGDFDPAALRGRMPLTVANVHKSYNGRVILEDVSFTLGLDSRVVLVGPNGAGKSTLLKILMGLETPDRGEVIFHPAVRLGYLHQEPGLFHPDQTLWAAYAAGMSADDERRLKAIAISSGLFRYNDLAKHVGTLSSGQERKLQIARLMATGANLLILDEPTNYVSFDVLEGMEDALRHFPGPIIAASHDRRFMQGFGGQIWELRERHIIKYLGGYEEYMDSLAVKH